jgi:hypothetical protein
MIKMSSWLHPPGALIPTKERGIDFFEGRIISRAVLEALEKVDSSASGRV